MRQTIYIVHPNVIYKCNKLYYLTHNQFKDVNLLTKRLHVIIKVLAVDQLPCSAESINHVCRILVSRSAPHCRTASGLPAVKSACPPAQLIQPRGAGLQLGQGNWPTRPAWFVGWDWSPSVQKLTFTLSLTNAYSCTIHLNKRTNVSLILRDISSENTVYWVGRD